jgi:N-acetylmuramoyl-L-alanine amidase
MIATYGMLAIAMQVASAIPRAATGSAAATPSTITVRTPPRPQRTVVVDAGHGGPDNGMTGPIGRGPKLVEKNITLAVAMRLGDALQQRGVKVVYTRTKDTLIALSDRGAIANRHDGKLFISIHVNAANPSWKNPGGARGVETYFLSAAKTEDEARVEKMENASMGFEVNTPVAPGDVLNFILTDMAQNEYLRESSTLADSVQRSLARFHPGGDRGVKQAGFRVLVTAFMPSVLVEIGFGSNPSEAEFLLSPSRQQAIADAIADAAVRYLDGYEQRSSGAR